VEAEAHVVGREPGTRIDVQREQVAYGVGVLDPVQSMDRRSSRVLFRDSRPIERLLEPRREARVGRGFWPWPSRRRPRALLQLGEDLFPNVCAAFDVREIDGGGVEDETRRPEPRVMATDAILIEDAPIGDGGRGGLLGRGGRSGSSWLRTLQNREPTDD